jgi:hypothetical protein
MKMVVCVFGIGVLISMGVRASADSMVISEESRTALLNDLGEIRGLLSEVKTIRQEGEKRNLREEECTKLEELRKLIEEKDNQLKDKIKKVEEEKQQLKERVVVQQAAITPQFGQKPLQPLQQKKKLSISDLAARAGAAQQQQNAAAPSTVTRPSIFTSTPTSINSLTSHHSKSGNITSFTPKGRKPSHT